MATNVKVIVKNNNVDFALKMLKKKLKDYNTLLDYQETLVFEKPSIKKRKAKKLAVAKQKYKLKQQRLDSAAL